MQFAVRVGDMQVCPLVDILKPHVGGPITGPGVATVLIGGMPAAIAPGDTCVCVSPIPHITTVGRTDVLIGKRGALTTIRPGQTVHAGATFVTGCPTVIIGMGGLGAAAAAGAAAAMEAAGKALELARAALRIKLEAEKVSLQIALAAALGPEKLAIKIKLEDVQSRLDSYNY